MTLSTRVVAVCVIASVVSLTAGGCDVARTREMELADRLEASQQTAYQLSQANAELQKTVVAQQQQIRTLQRLGDKRMDKLPRIQRISLGRYPGGVDMDGKPGDDGVRVFVEPIDQDGSTIKSPCEVTVQLFDLAAQPAEKNLIGSYHFSVEEASKSWSSGFMAYYYRFDCPWKGAPPAHDEITVRVELTEYLTGKTFTEQKFCKIKLPVAGQPAAAPAR